MSSLSPPSFNKKLVPKEAGIPRPRLVLQQGRSLMDWINISNKKLLASARLEFVDEKELSKHCSENDCWILLNDKIYDVTKYLSFHPGGQEELMRAAGCDATALFNELHAWVNFEALLKSCYVGQFRGDRRQLSPTKAASISGVDKEVNTGSNDFDYLGLD